MMSIPQSGTGWKKIKGDIIEHNKYGNFSENDAEYIRVDENLERMKKSDKDYIAYCNYMETQSNIIDKDSLVENYLEDKKAAIEEYKTTGKKTIFTINNSKTIHNNLALEYLQIDIEECFNKLKDFSGTITIDVSKGNINNMKCNFSYGHGENEDQYNILKDRIEGKGFIIHKKIGRDKFITGEINFSNKAKHLEDGDNISHSLEILSKNT